MTTFGTPKFWLLLTSDQYFVDTYVIKVYRGTKKLEMVDSLNFTAVEKLGEKIKKSAIEINLSTHRNVCIEDKSEMFENFFIDLLEIHYFKQQLDSLGNQLSCEIHLSWICLSRKIVPGPIHLL